jgi:hypothetical protein
MGSVGRRFPRRIGEHSWGLHFTEEQIKLKKQNGFPLLGD